MKHYQNNMLSERVFSLVYLFNMYMQVEQFEHKKQWKIKYKCSESVYLIYMETSLKKMLC